MIYVVKENFTCKIILFIDDRTSHENKQTSKSTFMGSEYIFNGGNLIFACVPFVTGEIAYSKKKKIEICRRNSNN